MNYQPKRNTAKNLLSKFGRSEGVILRKFISEEFNEETMETEKTYENHSGVGVKLKYTAEVIGRGDNIIQAGDVKILCLFDVAPTENDDQIIFGNDTFNIITASTLAPDARVDVLYTLQCRRA